MKFIGTTEEYLSLTTNDAESYKVLTESVKKGLTILWFTQSNQNKLIIDGDEFVFSKNTKVNFSDILLFLKIRYPFF